MTAATSPQKRMRYTKFRATILGDWKLDAALGSCLLLGLRHGFDYDHLAAISDITAVQRNWRSGLRLGMTYALGHAFTVAALGIAVLELHMGLPEGLDHWTERLIGLTLIVLGIGVVAGILRKDAHGHSHSRIESRLAIAINGVLWMAWQVRRCWNPQAPQPERFQWMYNGKSVFVIGILHGVGRETPSQLALFFLTANLGGTSRGMMGLAAFCRRPGGDECADDRDHGRSIQRQRASPSPLLPRHRLDRRRLQLHHRHHLSLRDFRPPAVARIERKLPAVLIPQGFYPCATEWDSVPRQVTVVTDKT